MKKIYYLHAIDIDNSWINNLYSFEDEKIQELDIESEDVNKLWHWYLKKFDAATIVDVGESIFETICKKAGMNPLKDMCSEEYKISQLSESGVYFPRVHRPIFTSRFKVDDAAFGDSKHHRLKELEKKVLNYPDFLPQNEKVLISGINQLSILIDLLKDIFDSIHPDEQNLNVYGHKIRNLMILACTEVEAQLKGIYCENSENGKDNLSTKQYFKLKAPLKLDNYSIKLCYYPWLNEFSPFLDWIGDFPSQSLPWYDNYNAIKHDRENSIARGTLKSAIEAVCAVAILLVAQYGTELSYWREKLGGFFQFVKKPEWIFQDYYVPPFEGEEWKPEKLSIK